MGGLVRGRREIQHSVDKLHHGASAWSRRRLGRDAVACPLIPNGADLSVIPKSNIVQPTTVDASHRRHLATLRGWLDSLKNFQTIGRNGKHRYNNQGHSMLTGIAAIQRFLGKPAESWEVSTKRSYHEEIRT